MKRLCVFCGSTIGKDPAFRGAARALGSILAKRKIVLVYGGGGIGLMGELSNAALSAGGQVIGVIPRALKERELANNKVTELHVVDTMHERKALMAKLSDGFIALPGGLGTLEEFAEMVTWSQLGIHLKPCGLLNTNGYYDFLIRYFDTAVKEGFIQSDTRRLILVEKDPERMVDRILALPLKGQEID